MTAQTSDDDSLYPFDERREVLPYVPGAAARVLDVGCGRGGFGLALRRANPNRTIWAIEEHPDFAAAAAPYYDRMLLGSFPDALTASGGARFDCIVFNDVLEHLVDPWAALDAAAAHLSPGGAVVASIPNVRNVRTVVDLVVRGDWTYVDMGVLDRTHLRFFTRKTIRNLFESAGMRVEDMGGINSIGRRFPVGRHLPKVIGDFAYSGFAVRARFNDAISPTLREVGSPPSRSSKLSWLSRRGTGWTYTGLPLEPRGFDDVHRRRDHRQGPFRP